MGKEEKKDKAKEEVNEKEERARIDKKIESQVKAIKILTVLVYMGAVSGCGILLAIYYVVFWDPTHHSYQLGGDYQKSHKKGRNKALNQPETEDGWFRFKRDLEHMPSSLVELETTNYIDKNFAKKWTDDPQSNMILSRDQVLSKPDIAINSPIQKVDLGGLMVQNPPIQNLNLEGLKDGQFRKKRSLKDIEGLEELPRQVFEHPRMLRESTIREFLENAHDKKWCY